MEVFELKKDTIYNYLKKEIISGRLHSGKQLPRETELAKSLGVGKITLRDSLARLEDEGYIKRIHGKGTFVYPENAKSKATSTIMVLHGTDSGFEAPWHYLVPEISHYASEKQFKSFITTDAAMNIFSESDIHGFVKTNNVIGVAIAGNGFNGTEPIISRMKAAGVPVVIAHGRLTDTENTGFASICVEEKNAWEDAIAYLAGLGHRRIGIIGSSRSRSQFRSNTFERNMELLGKYGAVPDPGLVLTADMDKKQLQDAVETLFRNPQKPTAILCFSDFFAVYVYDALKQMKLRIPEDVAVMGICGYSDARLLNPPLSTIDYGYMELARMAVEMLEKPEPWFDPLTGKGRQRIKPYKLVKRASTEPK